LEVPNRENSYDLTKRYLEILLYREKSNTFLQFSIFTCDAKQLIIDRYFVSIKKYKSTSGTGNNMTCVSIIDNASDGWLYFIILAEAVFFNILVVEQIDS